MTFAFRPSAERTIASTNTQREDTGMDLPSWESACIRSVAFQCVGN